MLTIYESNGKILNVHERSADLTGDCVWIDLVQPTPDEVRFVEEELGIEVPTRAEMREIEPSNRFYQENGAYFMTATVLYNIEAPSPSVTPVTFILAGDRLVTLRYAQPKAFPLYLQRVEKGDAPCATGAFIMSGILEALIHRMADLIERIQEDVDKLGQTVFDLRGGMQTRNRRLDIILKGCGGAGGNTARAEEAASSINRLLHFFVQATHERGDDPRVRQRIKAISRDTNSLLDHTKFLSGRISFILDATLGAISNEQNRIIKLFSVMAVILLPPTLVASVYGMNFQNMPELHWSFGYPFALFLMVVAAIIPYYVFRRKGWL
jgi:magnesium transporter